MARKKACKQNLFDRSIILVNSHMKKKKSSTKIKTTVKKVLIETTTSYQSMEEPAGLRRRSGHLRIAPVEYWNGDAVRYDDDGTLIGIENVGAGPSDSKLNNTVKHNAKVDKTSNTNKKAKALQVPEIYAHINTNPDRKRKKSFRGSNTSEKQSVADGSTSKHRDGEPYGDSLAKLCIEYEKSSIILSDSIVY